VGKCYQGFVPSNYRVVYCWLHAVYNSHLLCGNKFCGWGSGLGAESALAALIGFDSYGIEQDSALSEAAQEICDSFGIPVSLVNGSFVPPGAEDLVDDEFIVNEGELAMHTHSDGAYEELGIEIDDFDLIFAYPWPSDRKLVRKIFDRYAARGAILMVYDESETISLTRKI
jgi:hypothetical protein